MSSIDDLINGALSKPNTETFTFKGDGKMSETDGIRWNAGFDDGYNFALENYKLTKPSLMPKEIYDNHYSYVNGWFEGYRSGSNKVIDTTYPNLRSLSLTFDHSGYDIVYKDGRKEFVKME